MKLNYNVTGENRKQMVAVISQMAGVRPVYTRMPECAFLIGNIKVSKTGEMIWDERTDEELIGKVMEALSAVGFKADKSFRNILLPMLSHIRCIRLMESSMSRNEMLRSTGIKRRLHASA